MKNLVKYFSVVLLSIAAFSCYAQGSKNVYQFKIDNNRPVSELLTDSIIHVLSKRLINSGYKDCKVLYVKAKNEINIESNIAIEDEFINNWLIKPCKVDLYETYDRMEIILFLDGYPDPDEKKSFFESLNISNANYNDKVSNVGEIKILDSIGFITLKNKLQTYFPKDCLFAFQAFKKSTEDSTLSVFALKNNTDKLQINRLLKSFETTLDAKGRSGILLGFNEIGTKYFARITGKNINKALAFVIDGLVYSTGFIITPIEGGKVEIAGSFEEYTSKQLVNMINGGYLPVKLKYLQSSSQ